MRRRSAVATALSVLMVSTMSACSAVQYGMVGLQRELDGSLSAVVHMCEDYVNRVHLRDFDSEAYTTWTFESEVADTGSFTLPDDFATYLRDDHAYDLGASAYHVTSAGGPTFTADSVAALLPGQVLIDPFMVDPLVENAPMAQVVGAGEFEDAADGYCESL